MKLRLESDPGTTATLRLKGELDIAGCEEVESELRRLSSSANTVVVDLSDLDFLDSSGLRTLLQSHAELRDQGVRLALVRGGPAVHRVFEITRTDERLDFVNHPSEIGADGAG